MLVYLHTKTTAHCDQYKLCWKLHWWLVHPDSLSACLLHCMRWHIDFIGWILHPVPPHWLYQNVLAILSGNRTFQSKLLNDYILFATVPLPLVIKENLCHIILNTIHFICLGLNKLNSDWNKIPISDLKTLHPPPPKCNEK